MAVLFHNVADSARVWLRQFSFVFGLAMIALVWVGSEQNIAVQFEGAKASAMNTAKNLSRVFSEHVARAIRDADKRLLMVRAAYESSTPDTFDLKAWVGDSIFKSDLDIQFSLVGPDGMLVATNAGPSKPGVDLSDREHVKVHALTERDELFISKPVLGRASGKWSIQLTRKLRKRDGFFAGVLVASLDPYHLSKFYEDVDLGRDGAVTLVGFDGIIRARGGMSPDVLGRSMSSSEVLSAYKVQPEGQLLGAGVIDGIRRLLSYRVVGDLPLIVIVALSEHEVFSEVHRNAHWYRLVSVMLTLVIVVFMVSGTRSSMRLEATLADLAFERDEARRASASKSSFLAMMSHEIRTPMNAILGLTGSLLEERLQDSQRESLQTINRSADNLLEILNDILDFSKLEAGPLSLETIAFVPEEVSQSVISLIAPRAEAKGLELRLVEEQPVPVGVLGDAGRLRQVLLNLVSNAVKFTSHGSVSITCRVSDRQDDAATIEWSVADTGIGMSPAQIERLFKEYAQADASISRKYGGSGLGLAICKRIIEQMGGEIAASSELGRGAEMRFRVTLPLADAQIDHNVNVDTRALLMDLLDHLGRSPRILVVDDNATNRLVAAKMLEEFKPNITMAADGAEAVAAASKTPFDAILMDMNMPEMDGPAAAKRLRALGVSTPIIAFTANAFEEDKRICHEAGMNYFLPKPVRKSALIEVLRHAMQFAETVTESLSVESDVTNRSSIVFSEAVSSTLLEPQPPSIDLAVYNELAETLGPESLKEALNSFLSETSVRVDILSKAGYGDRDIFKREAHTIKGTAALFGFTRLSEVAHNLERNAHALEAEDLQTAHADLLRSFHEISSNREVLPLAA